MNTSPADPVTHYVTDAVARAGEIDGLAGMERLPVTKVGMIGAGTMGGGIAMNFANIGIPVHLIETRQDALDRGLATVRGHYERSARNGRFGLEEVDVRMGRLSGGLDLAALADCDLIVEAVFEDMGVKQDIFRRLDAVAKPGAILASNTSGLDIDAIAAVTGRPESVIGLHFFSPANVMKLVEVVRGAKTGDAVLATAMAVARDIGKIAVVSRVCPGFIGNRMLYPRQMRAQALLTQGAMPWDVDRVLKAFGFKMGPFEMADLAGLDIGWQPGATTADRLRDALCEAGRRGQKTRAGYYDYDDARRAVPSPVAETIIAATFAPVPGATPPDDATILESCLFPLVNEGAKILGEGVAQRASDIDVVWLYGYGWPQSTGGPMCWADGVGLERVRDMAARLGRENNWYAPAPLLERLVAAGGTFTG